MKRRRTLIVSLLLVAALCLGIGYAAINGELTINGTANIKEQPFKVVFTEYQEGTPAVPNRFGVTPTVSLTTPTSDLKDAPDSVQAVAVTVNNLQAVGDQVEFKLTVKNFNDTKVQVTPSVTTPAPSLEITTDWTTKEIDKNGSEVITVTVELKTPFYGVDNTDETKTETFEITLTASPVS